MYSPGLSAEWGSLHQSFQAKLGTQATETMGAAKAELTLQQATQPPLLFQTGKPGPGFGISRDGGKRIPYYILLAGAPAFPFSANAPAKLEPSTFRLPMPSRAQVKSN